MLSNWRTVIAAGLIFGVAGGGPTIFTNDVGDFLPAPELLAGLLTIAFAGVLVKATFRLLERGTIVRWRLAGSSTGEKTKQPTRGPGLSWGPLFMVVINRIR